MFFLTSFTDFLFPIVQEGTVLRLTILRALSCCGGCGRQGPPHLGASLPVLNSISCLGPTRPFSTATGPHHRGLLFGFGSKKCKCNRKLRHSTLAIQSHSIPETVCVTAGQNCGPGWRGSLPALPRTSCVPVGRSFNPDVLQHKDKRAGLPTSHNWWLIQPSLKHLLL